MHWTKHGCSRRCKRAWVKNIAVFGFSGLRAAEHRCFQLGSGARAKTTMILVLQACTAANIDVFRVAREHEAQQQCSRFCKRARFGNATICG
jgi:hypothetical protein